MNEGAVNDALLRQFLLGKLDDEVRERIESLFLTDSVMHERVLSAEQELIEDYLEDSLEAEDKERFVLRYAQTPRQQRPLRIMRSIRDWAVKESTTMSGIPLSADRYTDSSANIEDSIWSRLRQRLWRRPLLASATAAAAIVAIVLGMLWVNRWIEQRRHFAIEQELAQLNAPSSFAKSPSGVIVTLAPFTLRSSNSSPELELRNGGPVVELRLLWVRREQYPAYQAIVRRIRDGKTFIVPDLRVENGDGKTIRLLLPHHILTRGTYLIQLTGLAADRSGGSTEEYQFTVGE